MILNGTQWTYLVKLGIPVTTEISFTIIGVVVVNTSGTTGSRPQELMRMGYSVTIGQSGTKDQLSVIKVLVLVAVKRGVK